MNLVLEAIGLALILVALVVLAVVAGTWEWQAGAAVGAVEAGAVGGVLVALAADRERKKRPVQ